MRWERRCRKERGGSGYGGGEGVGRRRGSIGVRERGLWLKGVATSHVGGHGEVLQ
jgi:hypothetical protein